MSISNEGSLDTKGYGVLEEYLSVFYVSLGLGLRGFFVGGVHYYAKVDTNAQNYMRVMGPYIHYGI